MNDIEVIDGVETKTLLEPVPHYYIAVYPTDEFPELPVLNREVRNWCARNLGSGSWETQYDNTKTETIVGVYIDMDQPDHAMAVKLRWT